MWGNCTIDRHVLSRKNTLLLHFSYDRESVNHLDSITRNLLLNHRLHELRHVLSFRDPDYFTVSLNNSPPQSVLFSGNGRRFGKEKTQSFTVSTGTRRLNVFNRHVTSNRRAHQSRLKISSSSFFSSPSPKPRWEYITRPFLSMMNVVGYPSI